MKPYIIVSGDDGVGKTSLIQALTRAQTAFQIEADQLRSDLPPVKIYHTDAARFIEESPKNSGKVSQGFAKLQNNSAIDLPMEKGGKLVSCIWYCVDCWTRIRSQNSLMRFANLPANAILVITKSETLEKDEIKELMQTLLDVVPEEKVVFVSTQTKTGLPMLLDQTATIISRQFGDADEERYEFSRNWNSYYSALRKRWYDHISEEVNSYITWGASRAAAIAFIPLPGADVAPLIINEMYMIYKIGKAYGYAVDQTMMTMLLGVAGGSIAGKIAASALPFLKIPIAAGVTYGVGKATKAYFESGKSLVLDDLKTKFKEGFDEANEKDW